MQALAKSSEQVWVYRQEYPALSAVHNPLRAEDEDIGANIRSARATLFRIGMWFRGPIGGIVFCTGGSVPASAPPSAVAVRMRRIAFVPRADAGPRRPVCRLLCQLPVLNGSVKLRQAAGIGGVDKNEVHDA